MINYTQMVNSRSLIVIYNKSNLNLNVNVNNALMLLIV